MSYIATLLTLVATLLCHKPVPVHCSPPPGMIWNDGIDGIAEWPPDLIYLRYCKPAYQLRKHYVKIFAHELIHVQHHDWPHWKVYALDDWYEPIVARKIRAEK